MKLEEAVERLKKDLNKRDGEIAICFAQDLETALQEIEHLQKENEELSIKYDNTLHELRIFENESVPKNKIRKLIELWKPKLEETDKREEKAKTQEERVVLKCIGIRLDERIKTLQDLLKEE